MQLVRIIDDLPDGFDRLRMEAESEGHRNLSRLKQEWLADRSVFRALLAAVAEAELVGIGGLTPEPRPEAGPALRMRRLYVSRGARRQGSGRTLVNALLQEALDEAPLVTVNAHPDSAAFWGAMGFVAVSGRPWSHEFRRAYSAA